MPLYQNSVTVFTSSNTPNFEKLEVILRQFINARTDCRKSLAFEAVAPWIERPPTVKGPRYYLSDNFNVTYTDELTMPAGDGLSTDQIGQMFFAMMECYVRTSFEGKLMVSAIPRYISTFTVTNLPNPEHKIEMTWHEKTQVTDEQRQLTLSGTVQHRGGIRLMHKKIPITNLIDEDKSWEDAPEQLMRGWGYFY